MRNLIAQSAHLVVYVRMTSKTAFQANLAVLLAGLLCGVACGLSHPAKVPALRYYGANTVRTVSTTMSNHMVYRINRVARVSTDSLHNHRR